MDMPSDQELAEHVRRLRRLHGLSHDAVARAGGLSVEAVRAVEAGEPVLDLQILFGIARGLGLAPSELFRSLELRKATERRTEAAPPPAATRPESPDRGEARARPPETSPKPPSEA